MNPAVRGWGARVSDDEFFVLFGSFAGAGLFLYHWWAKLALAEQAKRAQVEFLSLSLAPPAALTGVFLVISIAGSGDVRGVPSYTFLYCLLGIVWFMGAARLMEDLGISFRDDAVERRNPAAAIILIAVMMAHAAIYACANIGNGPGWWTVVIAAFLGSVAWFLLWLLAERFCAISETITVERDTCAAIRLSGYALAMGLVCARGAAGDWTSPIQTVIEFQVAWPALLLTLAAILIEKLAGRPGINLSILIAAAYIGAGALGVWFAGPLPHNPAYDYLNTSSYQLPAAQ
jgi:hypothetical protein